MEATAATAALEGRYAALRAGAADLSTDELLDVIELAQREKDAASARQAVALAHLSARESHLREDGTWGEVHHGLGHQRLDAPELAAPRIGCSVHVAANRILTAIRQLTRTPAVVDAMATGDLDEYRASVVTEETEFLSDESAAEVVARVAEHWRGLAPGPLRRFVARTAAEVDPDAVAQEAEDERERRGLTRRTGAHGTDHGRGDFNVEHARGAWDAVTARAKQLVRDGQAETLQQARADAMMELILEHCDVKVVVHATRAANGNDAGQSPASGPAAASAADPTSRPATTAHVSDPPQPPRSTAGAAQDLVEVGGLGAPGTTFVPRDWLDRADQPADANDADGADGTDGVGDASSAGGAGVARGASSASANSTGGRVGRADPARDLTCDGVTGALLAGDVPEALASGRTTRSRTRSRAEEATDAYRIPRPMARLVRLRDGSCRFPGCSTPARQCDLDHVRAWPHGPTAPQNLMALCRRHHRIKQRPGWQVAIHPDATVTWTDPTGYRVTTRPVDHLHLVTARATQDSRGARGARGATADTTNAEATTGSVADTLADTLARHLALPTTFEDVLHALLDHENLPPRRTRPRVWNARGHLISGPLPRADLAPGHLPHPDTGRHRTVVLDLPHRPERPTPSAASAGQIPF